VNRTDRLYALVEELRAAAPQWRSASSLADHFEVSKRTIERDLSALQQLIYHGYQNSTPELVEAWINWFQRRAASFADVGSPFGPGRQITNETTLELSLLSNPASGYSIVNAENIDAAEQLLEGCPIVESVSLYEALPS
jgi:hypothetical protein